MAALQTKVNFKTIFKATLLIIAIVFVSFIGLAFYIDSQNKNAPQGPNNNGTNTSWNTYTSKVGRYTVQYPSKWRVNSSDTEFHTNRAGSDATGVIRLDIFENLKDDPNTNAIIIEHCHGHDHCQQEMEEHLRLFSSIDRTNITVGGLQAIKGYQRIPSRDTNTITVIPRVVITEPYKDTYYRFWLDGDLKNEYIFEKIIHSFQFVQ